MSTCTRLHRAKKTKVSSFKVHQTCTGPKNPKTLKNFREIVSYICTYIYTRPRIWARFLPQTKNVSTCHSSATTMMSQFDMCHSSPSTDTRSLAKTHSAQPCTNDHPLLESPMQWGGCGCVGIAFIRPWLLLRESKSLHMTLCKWGGGRCNDKFVLESQGLASSSTQFTHIHIVQEGFNSVSHAWPSAHMGHYGAQLVCPRSKIRLQVKSIDQAPGGGGWSSSGFPYTAKGATVPWLMDSSWMIWRFTCYTWWVEDRWLAPFVVIIRVARTPAKLEGHQEIVQLRTVLTALPLKVAPISNLGQVCASECIVSC